MSKIREPVQLGLFERILSSRRLWRDAAGLFISALGLITLITLLGWNAGGVVSAWADVLRQAFGVGALVLAVMMVGLGVPLALNSTVRVDAVQWIRIICAEVAFFALLALIHALAFSVDGYALARAGNGGGAVGWVLATLAWRLLGSNDGLARLASIVIFFGLFALTAGVAVRPLLVANIPRHKAIDQKALHTVQPVQSHQHVSTPSPENTLGEELETTIPKPAKQHARPELWGAPASVKSKPNIIKPVQKKTDETKKPKKPQPHEETLPPIGLLKAVKEAKNNDADIKRQADIIETTLAQFGLAGKVVEIRRGPTVTQFGIEPGYLERSSPGGEKRLQKIRVGQIAALQNDFALALSASSIRIEAPIPGRGLVGLEVPNMDIGTVDLRGIMEDEDFQALRAKSPLAIALGRDVSGSSMFADLSRMPHLLIAGTTGSGKSVCISSIAICLCMNNRPEDLKLVLIDPKMVELSRFNGLPHIIGRPESDLDRIPGVLRWVTREMDSRYKKFAEVGARNLSDYNAQTTQRSEESLPRIVVLIDELADLMLQSPIETEKTICRLAQMARATGIHLVVATQRPSVDVVTGLIKANFPARISFAVASSTDSRVILDQVGAESLLGRGDMLFLNPESGHPARLQGCFVSDKEVEGLIAWWRKQIETEQRKRKAENPEPETAAEEYVANRKPELDTPWETTVAEMAAERLINAGSKSSNGFTRTGSATSESGGSDDDSEDELIKRAMDIIKTSGNASTSLLQRKLRIGYPRAARLMEELQEMGYVGAASRQAGKGREVKHDDTDEV